MATLPVLDCGGCGACCREVDSPPGYAVIAAAQSDPAQRARVAASPHWADDAARWDAMPARLREGLAAFYRACGPEGDRSSGRACLWWDRSTRRCRHHAWRPAVCRAFEVGSRACANWRRRYPARDAAPDSAP